MAKTKEAKKKECPVTKEEFMENAKPLAVKIGDTLVSAEPKVFSSGGFGFYFGGPVTQMVNGTPVKCQVSCSIAAMYSKPVDE